MISRTPEYQHAYYLANRERKLAAHRAWCAKNVESRAAQRKVHYNEKRDAIVAAKHGIELGELLALREKQGDACAICKAPRGWRRLALDHNHQTGTVRGMLCYRCNMGLGYFRDDPELLARAGAYLYE